MHSTRVDELFRKTLDGEYEDDSPWEAVSKLRRMGTREVFEVASQWCHSPDPLHRARGVDVISQLGKTADHPFNSFQEESFELASRIIKSEKDIRPLSSAIFALGHLDNESAVPLIFSFKNDPSAEIRFAVACALGSYPNQPLSVEALVELMGDEDEDVRDWATFGAGSLGDSDSDELRSALARALDDSLEDVREEALVGLAKRGDLRALTPLIQALDSDAATGLMFEASCYLLGMEGEEPGWTMQDYADALRKRFNIERT